jgi:hypothetical protein
MAFQGKDPIYSNTCIYNKVIKQVNCFIYLCYNIKYENENVIAEKILIYNRAVGIMNQMFKTNLVQKHESLQDP